MDVQQCAYIYELNVELYSNRYCMLTANRLVQKIIHYLNAFFGMLIK